MIGCLLLHGFTGAPYEVEPLAEYLQENTNWLFCIPTLPGHGEFESLKGIHYQQWLDYAEVELKKLIEACHVVYVIGFSMGGLLASYLAAKYPVDKLILLSAAAYYLNPKQLVKDIRGIMADVLNGNLQENELFQRYKRKIITTPLAAAIQFRQLVSFIRPQLHEVEVPTFIAQGECDGIVPPKSAEYLFYTISSKQKKLIFIKSSKHHICHCEERTALFSQILEFLLSSETEFKSI